MAPVGSLLRRSLRTFHVFGANTEVGKTVFTTFLASAVRHHFPREQSAFLKPVSTGALKDADDRCKFAFHAHLAFVYVLFVLG
jgi:dethiobiotin synthetase/adenosylmethionine--8-amino-7-oxononanoate aminotransferase